MYLSRLEIRAHASRRPVFWERLGDVYSIHREIWRLFADDADKDRDFLYRLDLHRGRPRLYTLSPQAPRDAESLWKVETKPFEPVLQEGDQLAFSLRANPTIKRDGRRHDVVMDAKQKLREQGLSEDEKQPSQAELVAEHAPPWLENRAERLGVEFREVRADGYHVHQFKKPRRNGRASRNVTLVTCDFTGILDVREPERFLGAVADGVGPAKGFGCGLMLLRRVR